MGFPAKIRAVSDDTELEFVQPVAGQKKPMAKYVYTKADTKKGVVVVLSSEDIEYLIGCKLMEIIS